MKDLTRIREQKDAYLEFIQKVKLSGVGDESETLQSALKLIGSQKGYHPVLCEISGEDASKEEVSSLMPWKEENRG